MTEDNPYQPPQTLLPIVVRSWRSVLSYVVNGLILGTLAGSALMFAFSLFFITPPWGPRLYKGDERWDTIFFVAETMLPLAIVISVSLTLVILRFVRFQLRHREAAICLVLIAFLVASLRPVVSRIHRPGFTPLFELIPDTILRIVALSLLVTVLSGWVHWLRRRSSASIGST